MGYTHYWRGNSNRPFTNDEWAKILEGTRKIIAEAQNRGIGIFGWDGKDDPELTETKISFNGDAEKDYDHESFVLTKIPSDFEFCKTAHKPYDWAVVETLKLAEKVAPGVLKLSSDGGREIFYGKETESDAF